MGQPHGAEVCGIGRRLRSECRPRWDRVADADLAGWTGAGGVDQPVNDAGWPGVVFGDESSPVGGTVRVDPVSDVVDGDVVVIPAEGDEVVGVVAATVGALVDVVGLEPVTACTPFDGTLPLIPIQHQASDTGGDGFSQVGVGDGV